MGYQAGQPHRVDRRLRSAAGGRHQHGGPSRGAARRVELAVVVELDDLRLGHVARGLGREAHHQHRADREVRRDQHPRAGLRDTRTAQLLQIEARRPDHDVHARLDALQGVRQRDVGAREVDDDVSVTQDLRERRVERRIGATRELHVFRALHRGAHRLAHPPGRSGNRHPDHAPPKA